MINVKATDVIDDTFIFTLNEELNKSFDVFFWKNNDTIDGQTYEDYILFVKDLYPNIKYRAFGEKTVLWNEFLTISFSHDIIRNGKITFPYFQTWGEINKVKEFQSHFNKAFFDHIVPSNRTMKWVFRNSKNEISTINMKRKPSPPICSEFYPFIPNLKEFVDKYINSPESVLIFTGLPGTGKTTLINYILGKNPGYVQAVYDDQLMTDDQLYINFITGVSDHGGVGTMVLEDADLILNNRVEDNNPTMSKLLNISDGIIDSSKLKFIFTANLNSLNEIDEALSRPGRCYDIIEFRSLTFNEAKLAAEKIGTELSEERDYTLAEIFNNKKQKKQKKANKIGF